MAGRGRRPAAQLTTPRRGLSSPATRRASVLLPAPLSPTRARTLSLVDRQIETREHRRAALAGGHPAQGDERRRPGGWTGLHQVAPDHLGVFGRAPQTEPAQQRPLSQDALRRSVGDYAALVQKHGPVGDGRRGPQTMFDQNDGHAVLCVQPAHRVDHGPRALDVEAGHGLVEHQQARTHGQHGGDGQPLPLAARKSVGGMRAQMSHADAGKSPPHAIFDLAWLQPQVARAEGDLVLYPHVEQLRAGILKDHAHLPAHLGHRLVAHRPSAHADAAAHRGRDALRYQPVETLHERALAAARRPCQKDALAGVDLQVDLVQRHSRAEAHGQPL